jgi:nitrogen regulatory protein P-II 1
MSYLVVLIVDNPDDYPSILGAWEELGISGVTILESTGLGRIRKAGLGDDFPLMPSLEDFLGVREESHRTLISVVENQDQVTKMVDSAQQIIGNLDDPHTGFLFVVPVIEAYGLGRGKK